MLARRHQLCCAMPGKLTQKEAAMMEKTLFVFGFGYSARALAEMLGDEYTIAGTSRERSEGVIQWPGDCITEPLSRTTHLLISAAPTTEGDPVLLGAKEDIRAIAHQLQWVGYLSTTGVYGDHQGGWVDESTPLTPTTIRGQQRVRAEAEWQAFAKEAGFPLHIFRLAGIYGPGRGPFSKVKNGTARRIIKKDQVFSRIHAEDIAQVLAASMAHPMGGRVYNVCDDVAAPPEDVLAYAATLLDLPVPLEEDFATTDLSPMARSFYAESKRVDNSRIKNELGVVLRYPDYKTGLKALAKTPS